MVKILQYQMKLIALWTAFLLGLLFHTQLALMPLFHGEQVISSHTHEALPLSAIFWMMFAFYVIPLLVIALTPFLRHHHGNQLNFGLTVIYSILNIAHLVLDIVVAVPPYQLALMAILVCIGGALNLVTFNWMRRHSLPMLTASMS